MHDDRLFNSNMRYMWNRIINVVFIRKFNALKHRSGTRIIREWYDLQSIEYPANQNDFVATNYIDTWYQGRFRYGNDHFPPKTKDLQKKKLK